MATLNAGSVAMNEKIIAYGMIVAATADILTAIACWCIVFLI